MKRLMRSPRALLNGLFVAVAAAAMFLLWPASLGGSMTYVVVAGPSMEPTYSSGDFVVARTQSDYERGDIVVYRTPEGQVIHRIVAEQEDGTYRLRGDNNPDHDIFTPSNDEAAGAAQLHVPGVGRWLLILRTVLLTPPMPYLLAGLVFLVYALPSPKPKPEDSVGDGEHERVGDLAGART